MYNVWNTCAADRPHFLGLLNGRSGPQTENDVWFVCINHYSLPNLVPRVFLLSERKDPGRSCFFTEFITLPLSWFRRWLQNFIFSPPKKIELLPPSMVASATPTRVSSLAQAPVNTGHNNGTKKIVRLLHSC